MTIDLESVIRITTYVLFTALAGVISTTLVPWLRARRDAEQDIRKRLALDVAVQAAEMMFPESGSGSTKLAAVMSEMTARKINVARSDIEAAVFRLPEGARGGKESETTLGYEPVYADQ